jgi:hypothetical protein
MNYINTFRYKTLFFLVIALFYTGCSSQQISQTIGDILKEGSLSESDVAAGLKEALVKGANSGTSLASQVDGFYKNPKIRIPLPPEVQNVESKLRQLGMGNQLDKFHETLNRGAELAAKEAAPVFVSAIKSMTIRDAWDILKGSDNAATEYLKRTTSGELRGKFQPIVQDALEQVKITSYYDDFANVYNRIPGVKKLNPDLNDYVTGKAMDGLFTLVAEEEENIRENPAARTTELLRKVFSQSGNAEN